MKRILIFSLAYYPHVGGAEVAIKEITDRLGEDIEFDMVSLRLDRKSPRCEKIGNVILYRVGWGTKRYFNKIWYVPAAFFKALSLHRKRKYDLSWAMMTYMGFSALFLKWYGGVPYLLTIQEGDTIAHITGRKRIKVVSFLYKKVFINAKVIQSISQFLADFARSMGYTGKIEVIPNGVDLSKFTYDHMEVTDKAQKEETLIITASRLVEKNAVGDIIEALSYLPENVTLVIAGNGPLKGALEKSVVCFDLDHRVSFIGFVSNEELPKYLRQADIFVRPSLSEGQGISFLEAMAAGIPVIATPVGGIVDFIKDGETGLFCEVHNPKSIAQKVEKLIKDRESRDYIVKNARRLVEEKYDWDLIVQQMKEKVFS